MCAKLATTCRCGLTVSAGRRETTPGLLAVLLAMQPWMLLPISAAWAHCRLLPQLTAWGPQGLFPRAAPQLISLYHCKGLFLPNCRTLHLSLLYLMKFLLAHSFSVERAALPSSVLAGPSNLISSANLIGMQYQNPEVCWKLFSYLSSSMELSHFASP